MAGTTSTHQDADLLNAAAEYLAAASARPLGSMSDEVKLAVERIAREIKAVKASMGGGNSLEGRVAALEAALADVTRNEMLIANGLAKAHGQTPIFGCTVTMTGMPGGSTVTWEVDGTKTTGATCTTYVGANVKYTVSCNGYRTKTGEKQVTGDETIKITLDVAVAEDILLSGNFADPHKQLVNLVDNNNFQISGSNIQSGPSSYYKNNGTSYGYIKLTTKEQCTLRITGYVSSENNYDFGGVYVGSKIYKPTQSQAKSGTTDSAGSYLIRSSGSNSSREYTMTLNANTTYYLNFFYVKEGSGNSNSDRFFVSKIQYRAVI